METVKVCSRCKLSKHVTEYAKGAKAKDGLYSYCRTCHAADTLERYYKNYDRQLAARRAWREVNRDKVRQSNRLSARRSSKRSRLDAIRGLTRTAIKAGRLIKRPCVVCGGPAEVHHPDYSKPLDVVWLCQQHHKEEHRRLRLQKQVAA